MCESGYNHNNKNNSLTLEVCGSWNMIGVVGLCGTGANAGANFWDKSCAERALIGVKLNETLAADASTASPLLSLCSSIV